MSKYLVTGGSGFIGSHVVEELVNRGDKVTVIDDLSEGLESNLASVWDKIIFLEKDITGSYLPDGPFDVVYHLAAKHSVPKSFDDPQKYFDVNVGGSWDVFAKYQDCRIVNVSSSSAVACKSPYAISKKTVELCADLFKNIVSLRYFNVFGERQALCGAVVPAFCVTMLRGEQPTIYGDGNQDRDFTYVKDVADATVEFGEGKWKDLKGVHEVGYGSCHTVNEIFEIISKQLRYQRDPIYAEERIGDVKHSISSGLLGTSKYGFEKGINRTVSWFKAKKYI